MWEVVGGCRVRVWVCRGVGVCGCAGALGGVRVL